MSLPTHGWNDDDRFDDLDDRFDTTQVEFSMSSELYWTSLGSESSISMFARTEEEMRSLTASLWI